MYTFEQICEYIKMPEEAATLAKQCLCRVKDNEEFNAIKADFARDCEVEARLDRLAANIGERPLMLKLAFCFYCTDIMYERYREQKIEDSIYLDSLTEIRVWAISCYKNKGEWGMNEFCWVKKTLWAKLYRLGRMQYEYSTYPYDRYEAKGKVITKGDKVIFVHIPEDGPFPKDAREASYKMAVEFFGYNVFACETYLFYPKHYDFLPEKSNIISFMNEYDIVYSEEDDQMKDMWRIFGERESYDPATLPRETSLQRAYADHLAKTGKNGWGYGVMIYQ